MGFPRRRFLPERMALNLTGEKTPLTPKDEVKFSVWVLPVWCAC
ncbi:MAG: hypothetical protein ACLRP3_05910 [Escherichia sp.]